MRPAKDASITPNRETREKKIQQREFLVLQRSTRWEVPAENLSKYIDQAQNSEKKNHIWKPMTPNRDKTKGGSRVLAASPMQETERTSLKSTRTLGPKPLPPLLFVLKTISLAYIHGKKKHPREYAANKKARFINTII